MLDAGNNNVHFIMKTTDFATKFKRKIVFLFTFTQFYEIYYNKCITKVVIFVSVVNIHLIFFKGKC